MSRWIRKIVRTLILFYQKAVSPLLGQRCRYFPSCSEYARLCFEKHSTGVAFRRSITRIIRCTPFHTGGIDFP